MRDADRDVNGPLACRRACATPSRPVPARRSRGESVTRFACAFNVLSCEHLWKTSTKGTACAG